MRRLRAARDAGRACFPGLSRLWKVVIEPGPLMLGTRHACWSEGSCESCSLKASARGRDGCADGPTYVRHIAVDVTAAVCQKCDPDSGVAARSAQRTGVCAGHTAGQHEVDRPP